MACKVFVLLAIIVAAQGSIIPQYYHGTSTYIRTSAIDHDDHPQYTFSYDINDPHTGDVKNQQESRAGDVVHGRYSLVEPNGMRRTVDYASDPIHGFNAIIRRDPATGTSGNTGAHGDISTTTTTTTPIPTPSTSQEPSTESTAHASSHSHINIVRTVPQPTVITNQPHFIRTSIPHTIPTLQLVTLPEILPYRRLY